MADGIVLQFFSWHFKYPFHKKLRFLQLCDFILQSTSFVVNHFLILFINFCCIFVTFKYNNKYKLINKGELYNE